MKPIASLFAAFCLCTASAVYSAGTDGDLLTALPRPFAAPKLDLPEPDGHRVRLSDYQGRPVIVNFWATWCPPCRAEMPSLQRAWEKLRQEGIGVIAVNVGEDADTIKRFRAKVPVTFPLPMDLDSRVTQAWTVNGLPTTFVIDSQGQMAYVATGERDWDAPAVLDLVRALKNERK